MIAARDAESGGMNTILRRLFSQQKSALLPDADEISEEQQDPDVAKQTAAIIEPGPVEIMATIAEPNPFGADRWKVIPYTPNGSL